MEQVGRGSYRVGYLGADGDVADWVGAGFERAEEEVGFVAVATVDDLLDCIESTQRPQDARMRSPHVEFEEPLDALVCADDGDWDPTDVVTTIREHESFPVVLFVGDGGESLASDAIAVGVDGYVRATAENPTTVLAERVLELAADHREQVRAHRRRERAAHILDANPAVVTVVAPGANITYQNGRLSEVLGFEADAGDGFVSYQRIHSDDWQSLREAFYDAVIDPSYVPTVEFRVKDADGEWRTLEARGRNCLDDPLVGGFVVTTRDISERKEREQELEGYRRIVESAAEPMYALDPEGHFTWVNESFLEKTGYEREFVLDSHVSAFMRQQDVQTGADLVADLLATDSRDWGCFEFVAENVEGDIRRFEDNVALLTDDDGNFRGTVGVLRDVTDGESVTTE